MARVREKPVNIRLMLGVGSRRKAMSPAIATAPGSSQSDCLLSDWGVSAVYQEFEDEGHVSVLPILISRALRFALHPEQQ